MCRVVWVGGREGVLWLPAGGIRASQGTFSSFSHKEAIPKLKFLLPRGLKARSDKPQKHQE